MTTEETPSPDEAPVIWLKAAEKAFYPNVMKDYYILPLKNKT